MIDVFISYSRRDQEIVKRIYNRLVEAGIDIWTNSEIKAGDSWIDEIDRAMDESNALLVVLSDASVQSLWVAQEYRHFLAQNKRIYPVLISSHIEIPYHLRHLQILDLSRDFDAGLEKLVESISYDKAHPGSAPAEVVMTQTPSETESHVTLRLKLKDMEVDRLKSLIAGLTEAGVHEIEVIDVSEG